MAASALGGSEPPPLAAHAIRLASLTYGVPESQMRSVAYCETGGTWSARSLNSTSGAAGLFQFLSSTWRGTPYRSLSRFDVYANALAAAWLVRQDGGWGEWSCRP